MPTILDQITAAKRQQIAAAKEAISETALRAALPDAPPARSFLDALAQPGPIKLIAEVKRASPSRGRIRSDFNPAAIARTYEQHGAACVSVLTEQQFFQGSLEDLRRVRAAVQLPLLRKDFILDTYQLLEARLAGADAVLLIAECLQDRALGKLHDDTLALGMTPLVEFYEPANLPRVLDTGAALIGVNNRDLRSLAIDLEHTIRMTPRIPDRCVVVAESGITSREDVLRLEAAGVDAVLVGEHLMASEDIGAAVQDLLGR